MARAYIAGAFGLGLACSVFASVAQAETIITTQWENTKLTQDKCLEHAEAAIRAAGFKTLPHTPTTRHGMRGNYTAAVRCLLDKGVVFFIVAGPSRTTEKYSTDIIKHL
jgi:hypothetical protein